LRGVAAVAFVLLLAIQPAAGHAVFVESAPAANRRCCTISAPRDRSPARGSASSSASPASAKPSQKEFMIIFMPMAKMTLLSL